MRNRQQSKVDVNIRRHNLLQVCALLPLSGAWIAVRFMLVPILWIPYRLGANMNHAFIVDSFMKRMLFPLTEQADQVVVRSEIPANLPNVKVTHLKSFPDPTTNARNGVARHARTVGDDPITLKEFARGRPLFLIVYRGSWCPYARLHLADFVSIVDELEDLGVAVIAVSAHNHYTWWWSKGVRLSFAADPAGDLFRALGVYSQSPLAHRVWGLLLPAESVFFFDADGKLVIADVRQLSSTKIKQTFCAAEKWLGHAQENAIPQ
jgi:peroxiredoxin